MSISNLRLDTVLNDSGRTIYGLSVLISSVTGEDVKTVHKRLRKWANLGIPPKFEIAGRDLAILGYTIEIRKI